MPIAAYFYLLFLQECGYVECLLDDRQLITDVRVLADASNPPGSAEALGPKRTQRAAGSVWTSCRALTNASQMLSVVV